MNREPLSQLRERLRELDYNEPVVPECQALVSRLLSDVESASSKSSELASKLSNLEAELSKSREQVFPLKRECARLVRENNQLHMELIKQTEDIDRRERDLALQIKKYQGEAQTAVFMLGQNQKKLRDQESSGSRLRAKLDSILGSREVVTISAGDHTVLEQGVPGDKENAASNNNNNNKTSQKSKYKVGDPGAISELQSRVDVLEEEKLRLEAELRDAGSRIALRDGEIQRLGRTLEETVETDRHGSRQINRSNAMILEQMTDQIDFLTAQLAESQKKLASAEADTKAMSQANILAETATAERDESIAKLKALEEQLKIAQSELRDTKAELEQLETTSKSSAAVEDVGALLDAYQNDKKEFATKVQNLESLLAHTKQQLLETEEKLDEETRHRVRIESDLKITQEAKLSVERDVKLLEDSLVQLKNSQAQQSAKEGSNGNSSSQLGMLDLRAELAKLELANQQQSKTNEFLRSQLDAETNKASTATSKVSELEQKLATRSRELDLEMEKSTRAQSLLQSSQSERMQLQRQIDDLISQVQESANKERRAKLQLEEAIAARDKESDRLRLANEEIQQLTAELSERSKQIEAATGARLKLEGLSNLPDVVRELEEQVNRWRSRAGELDGESRRLAHDAETEKQRVQELTRERDLAEEQQKRFREQLEKTNLKCQSLEIELETINAKCEGLKADCSHYQSLVGVRDLAIGEKVQLEAKYRSELDAMKTVVQKTKFESDACALRERMLQDQVKDLQNKLQVEEQASLKLQESHSASQHEVRRQAGVLELVSEERTKVREQCNKLVAENQTKSKKLRELELKLGQERSRVIELESQVEQLKSLFAQLDSTREGLESRLKESRASLEHEKQAKRDAEQSLVKANEGLRREAEKSSHLEQSTKQLTEQVRMNQKKMSESDHVIDQLSQAMKTQEERFRELEKRLGASTLQVHNLSGLLKDREAELEHARAQLGAFEKRCADEHAMVELRQRELRSASQDLANMTRENQSVNAALQSLRGERDRVRSELGDAHARLARVEGLLESGKLEQAELMKVYRRVCEENTRMKQSMQDMNASHNQSLQERQTQASELALSRKQVAELEESRRKQWIELQALQRQVGELTRRLHEAQSRVATMSNERNEAAATADSARDATKSMVETQDNLRWELGQAKAEVQELGRRLESLQQENHELSHQLQQERQRQRELEGIVSRAREGEARAVLAEQSKDQRIASLQSQVMQLSSSNTSFVADNSQVGEQFSRHSSQSPQLGPSPIQLGYGDSKPSSEHHSSHVTETPNTVPGESYLRRNGSDSESSEASSTLQRKVQDLETLVSEQTKTIWDLGRDD